MENKQPEALALASLLETLVIAFGETDIGSRARAAKELRRLHARVEELEAMLDALGAGGVSAQRVMQGKDHIAQPTQMATTTVVLPEPIGTVGAAPGTSGFTLTVFEAARVPVGTNIYTEQQVRELLATGGQAAATTEGATNEVTVLPDGSAFAVYSYPLPKGHWLYAPREYEQGAEEPKELAAPILTHAAREQVVSAIRYAVRAATDCGKETDFDPDALVQNAVYALCGPFNKNQPQPQADAPVVMPEPNAWAAVYFSGKQAGKIYTTCDTKEQIEAYIHQVHQSNDSITLRAEPIYMQAAAPQPQADGRDAQRYRWLIDYFISDRVDLDDAIVAAKTSEDIAKIIDAAIAAAKGEL